MIENADRSSALRASQSTLHVLGIVSLLCAAASAQNIVYAGNLGGSNAFCAIPLNLTPVFPPCALEVQSLGGEDVVPGVNNTQVVGENPVMLGKVIAFLTNEAYLGSAGQDINCNGTTTDFVVRVMDIDAGQLINTRVIAVQGTTPALTRLAACGIGLPVTLAAWISDETALTNFQFPNWPSGADANNDGDMFDRVVVVQAVQSSAGCITQGDTWVIAPPASPPTTTLVSRFQRVSMSGQIMVLEEEDITNATPPSGNVIHVLSVLGFNNPNTNTANGMRCWPDPLPNFTLASGGHRPVASYDQNLLFPLSRIVAFEQRENQNQVMASFNPPDTDLCDRIICYQQITTINTNLPPFPPGMTTITVSLGPICRMATGQHPAARPHATFGNFVGFDALSPPIQPGNGPEPPCGPTPLPAPQDYHAQRGRAAAATTCTTYLPDTYFGERVSVAGRVFAHELRETASFPGAPPGQGTDFNNDGNYETLVAWADQQTGSLIRYRIVGPGRTPSAEDNTFFQFQPLPYPPPPGGYAGIIAYSADETFASTGDLNHDGDQNDRVIMFALLEP
ncbi:MAG: hypothetical protein L0323_07220 [Planctomycetes bacterium]|nr:hypothetical protein [Planctomycetota bacterium]